MAHRAGFVIPNATDAVISNRQAEPDAGDFSVLGNDNYGVLTGFDFTILPGSGTFSINTVSGVNSCVINGKIYTAPPSPALSYELTGGGSNDRFDLMVYAPLSTASNKLQVIGGAEAGIRPKYPDIPPDVLVIASIFVPMNSAYTDLAMMNVADKRRWLLNGARGAVGHPDVFLENRAGGIDPTFKVLGSGDTIVGSDTGPHVSFRPYDAGGPKFDIIGEQNGSGVSTEVLFKTPKVTIQGNLAITGTVTATGMITGSNLLTGNITGTPPAGEGHTGSLYQDTSLGRVFIKANDGHWAEIMKDEYPPGTLIASLLPSDKASKYLTGSWIACAGQIITGGAITYPNIAECFDEWVFGDDLHMPDYTDCTLGSAGPQNVGKVYNTNEINLTPVQMPAHRHFGGGNAPVETSEAGGHSHSAKTKTGAGGRHTHIMGLTGQHLHQIKDPLHVHIGADHGSYTGLGTFTNFMAQMWGGSMVVDMNPADAGHGTAVDITNRTMPAYSGINSTNNDGLHSHTIAFAEDHDHPLNLAAENHHRHTLPVENPIGVSAPVDVRSKFISVNWYVKA